MKGSGWRLAVGAIGLAMAVLAVLYAIRHPDVLALWPWSGDYGSGLSPLSTYFLSSIAAAIAAPLLWMALSDSVHVAAAGALNLAVSYAGIAAFAAMSLRADPDNRRLAVAAALFAASAAVNLAIYVAARRLPPVDPRPLPASVRHSFVGFIVVLVLVGGALVLKRPDVIPWDLTPEAGVVYGWIFLGASVYFAYALRHPRWEYAAGPLCGFLAYDLVLIGPFLRHFADVRPEHFVGLCVYTAVVIYSGVLAVHHLFVSRRTRIVRRVGPRVAAAGS